MVPARSLVATLFLVALGLSQEPRPNVILLVSDDQGWWDIGAHGNEDIETPTLDRLAAEGVELTRFYVAPVCAPTRAGLMTGRHYVRTGLYNTRFGGDTLHPDEVTVAELLRSADYRTGMFGKWHLGEYLRHAPDRRGFDEAIYFPFGHTERYFYPEFLLKKGEPIHVRGHITDVLTDAAITFVRKNRQRPFFLYVPYNVPHTPHFLKDELVAKYVAKGLRQTDARIYGLIEQMDSNIGRLLEAVEEEGLRDRTAVFFMSDNGGTSRHYSAGLRGRKGSVYEGGVRSPLFARMPGRFPAGRKTTARASHLDLLPTICDLAGVDVPSDRTIDGRSLLTLLTGSSDRSPHERLVHIWDRHRPSLTARWAIAGPRYKLVGEELYDLETDPAEKHDIAKEQPEIAASLRQEFESWFRDISRGQKFEPLPVVVGDDSENPIELYPSWARHRGTHANVGHPYSKKPIPPEPLGDRPVEETTNYTFDGYLWDTIDRWREPGESVHWKIDVARAGDYEVTVDYGCDIRDAGGKFAIEVGNELIVAAARATDGPTLFESHVVGTLSLKTGPAILRVRVIEAPGKELMRLNRVRLEKK